MSIRVGFASIDGRQVDQSFAGTPSWWIYDIGDDVSFVEKRSSATACVLKSTVSGKGTSRPLDDCDLLFVAGGSLSQLPHLPKSETQIIPTYTSVQSMISRIRSRVQRNYSLDYYRKVQNLGYSYENKPFGNISNEKHAVNS